MEEYALLDELQEAPHKAPGLGSLPTSAMSMRVVGGRAGLLN